jgi:transcriptional regulator with XRE-family HTH domain
MTKTPRSLQVRPDAIERVKAAYQRSGYSTQQSLAHELGLNLDTVNRYLNGKPVDRLNFFEISTTLGLELEEIALLDQSLAPENELDSPATIATQQPEDEVIDAEYEYAPASEQAESASEGSSISRNKQGQVNLTVIGQNNHVEKVFGEMTIHGNISM